MQGLKFIHSTVNPDAPVAYCSFNAMHTRIELLFVQEDEALAKETCSSVQTLTGTLERELSRHLPASDLYALNHATESVEVNQDLYFALELCEQMRAATKGYYDIASLSGSRIRPAYETSPANHRARRCGKEIMLDLGGFAKGFAIEKVRDLLENRFGVVNALMNFGNSSVIGLGHHPLGDCWLVSPSGKDKERTFRLKDSALSISGKTAGVREHIINPRTGTYASREKDIAVLGQSALVCEILSTALYAAPDEEWDEMLKPFSAYKVEKL